MPAGLDRLLAVDRALHDVRFAQLLLLDPAENGAWRGPAHDAFLEALETIRGLLRIAETALERERTRAQLALWAAEDHAGP
jgi:hypothetical protein